MNQSEDLTFRDFKKAEKCSGALKIDLVFLEDFSDGLFRLISHPRRDNLRLICHLRQIPCLKRAMGLSKDEPDF
jgi:hypothetical protein